MQCQSPCVASQPSHPPAAQPAVKKQTPAVQHNSFHRFLNILSNDHARKAEEMAESQTPCLNSQEKKDLQGGQGLNSEPEVEHSRSRDKRRRLPKSKNPKKPGKKGKQSADTINSELVTNLAANVAINEIPSISTPIGSSQAVYQQTKESVYQGISVVQDFSGIPLPREQYQCGEIIEASIKNDNLANAFITQAQQQSMHLQKDQPNVHQSLVSQALPELIAQIAEKGQQEPKKNIQNKKNSEENIDQIKEKVNPQSLQIDGNERYQRKNYYIPEDRQWNFKSKMCYDFLKGRCKKPVNQCTFAHGYEDLKRQRRMKFICRNYTKGFCKKSQEQCKFYHQKIRDRDYSPHSEHSSLSDEQKRRSNKLDVSVIKEEKKEDKKQDKKELSHLQRQFQQRRDERREGKQRKQEKRDQRKQEKKDDRRDDKKERKEERKHSRRSQQRFQDKRVDRTTQKRPQTKKYAQTFQAPNPPENNQAFMPPFPYFSYVSGYFAPNQLSQQQSWNNRSQQVPNAQQSNVHYGYSSFCAPMFFPTPNSFPPNLQKIPYSSMQFPNPSFNLPNQQFNNRTNIGPNMGNFQPFPPNFPQNYQVFSPPQGYFQQFYPCFVPPQYQSSQQTPHNVSNDSLSPVNSDCEYPLNSTMEEKRQRQKSGREHKRNNSKDRSKDRKQKKHHRR